jgi:hypothetical protein
MSAVLVKKNYIYSILSRYPKHVNSVIANIGCIALLGRDDVVGSIAADVPSLAQPVPFR